PISTVIQLIGRVSDDYVELHVFSKQLGHTCLDVIGVNEGIRVGLKLVAAIEGLLAGSAIPTLAPSPRMLRAFEPDMPIVVGEALGDGVLAEGVLRAVQAPARQ